MRLKPLRLNGAQITLFYHEMNSKNIVPYTQGGGGGKRFSTSASTTSVLFSLGGAPVNNTM